jgi:hypothetical protein
MYKCRCSKIGDILTNPRSKSETYSKTAMSAVFEQYIADVTGRNKTVTSKYMDKGSLMEEDSISLLSYHDEAIYFKNEKHFTNDLLTGTPDIVTSELVIDIKSSWDVFTFSATKLDEIDKGYYAQLQGYMALTGARKAQLCYVLVNSPEHIINFAKADFERKNVFNGKSWDDELKNYLFDDLHIESRIHKIEIEYDEAFIQSVYERVELLREYYDSLKSVINFKKAELKEGDLP